MTPIAMMIADGMKAESMAMIYAGLVQAGAIPVLLSVGRGTVKSADGQEFEPHASLHDARSVIFDAVVLPDGQQAVDCLANDSHLVRLLKRQYRECKTILALGASAALLKKAGIAANFPDGTPDPGIIVAPSTATGWIAPLMTAIDSGYGQEATAG